MRLVSSERQSGAASPFGEWLHAVARSSDAALGATLAVGELGEEAAEALRAAAFTESEDSEIQDALLAITARDFVCKLPEHLQAFCLQRGGRLRWALQLPRGGGLVDMVLWEMNKHQAGELAVLPYVRESERLAHVNWLAHAVAVDVCDARDALAHWVLAAPDRDDARAVLRPYAWLLGVEAVS